jgi:hypothetical protein
VTLPAATIAPAIAPAIDADTIDVATIAPGQLARALGAYLDEVSAGARPFSWSRHNCAHFAAAWWARCGGGNALAGVPMPADALAAARWLRAQHAPLREVVSRHTGRAWVCAGLAQLGDVVMLRTALANSAAHTLTTGLRLGICIGRHAAVLADAGAIAFEPMAAATAAWPLPGRQA